MSILEKFVAFAEALPDDRRVEIEEILSDLMGANSADCEFTPEEIAELDRRCADESEEWIDGDVVRKKLRRLFE